MEQVLLHLGLEKSSRVGQLSESLNTTCSFGAFLLLSLSVLGDQLYSSAVETVDQLIELFINVSLDSVHGAGEGNFWVSFCHFKILVSSLELLLLCMYMPLLIYWYRVTQHWEYTMAYSGQVLASVSLCNSIINIIYL